MSKKVRDLRLQLEALATSRPDLRDELVTGFLQSLTELDDMSIEAFLSRIFAKPKPPGSRERTVVDTKALTSRLRSALPDDDRFHDEIEKLAAQKAVTKPVLTKIYYDLFKRSRGVPSKATRADLLRLIEDERTKLVRDGKMRELLMGQAVPAE